MFDLDEAPDGALDGDSGEEMDDEFGVDEDDEEMLGEDEADEVDSAFASSDEGEGGDGGDEDAEMAEMLEEEDEDGAITTNLEDDLEDEGYTLPAVDGEEEEFEHGTSLKDVEGRMRWLVGVCCGGEDKVSKGVPGRCVVSVAIHRPPREEALISDPAPTTSHNCNTT